jgi:hypothetical protein
MRNHASAAKQAVVIGGSLGGLFAGLLLRSIRWDVDIYERSPHDLDSRGAASCFSPRCWRRSAALACNMTPGSVVKSSAKFHPLDPTDFRSPVGAMRQQVLRGGELPAMAGVPERPCDLLGSRSAPPQRSRDNSLGPPLSRRATKATAPRLPG